MTPRQFLKLFLTAKEVNVLADIELVKQQTQENIKKHFARKEDDGFYPPKNDESLGWVKENGRKRLLELERQLKKIRMDRKFCGKPKVDGVITPDMVARAKNHPIENLVEINKQGFTKCFGHNDKHPSAYCKKNFIHCFVCQKSWDTIAVLMEREGLTFKDAVLKLQ